MKSQKKQKILNAINVDDFTNITELAKILHWPRTTLMYYINELLSEGLIIKEHGSISKKTFSYENKTLLKSNEKQKEKKQIAKIASKYINDGDIIYIDSGSTTLFLINYLKSKSVIIYTNNIALAQKLPTEGFKPKVFMVPGEIYMQTSSITGVLAINFLSKVFIDKAFMGVNLVKDNKYITTNQEEAVLKEAILKNAKQSFILFDKSKISNGEGKFIFGQKQKNIREIIK